MRPSHLLPAEDMKLPLSLAATFILFDRLVVLPSIGSSRKGTTSWRSSAGRQARMGNALGRHSRHSRARRGNIMVQQGASKVVEIDPAAKQVVWTYDSAEQNGNAGKPVEVHAFQPLGDGPRDDRRERARPGSSKSIVDGKLLKEVKLKVESSPSAHRHAAGSQAGQRQLPGLPRRGRFRSRVRRPDGQDRLGIRSAAVRQRAERGSRSRSVWQQVLCRRAVGQRQHADLHGQRPQRAGSDAAKRKSSGRSSNRTCRTSRWPGSRRSKCCPTATTSSAIATPAKASRCSSSWSRSPRGGLAVRPV